jgi:hypothetical protein
MRKLKRNRPTIGVLAGWQAYTGTIHSYLDYVFRGIQAAAHDYDSNLMIGCGVNSQYSNNYNPAWPVMMDNVDFVPVGPWNTDGLILARADQRALKDDILPGPDRQRVPLSCLPATRKLALR